jgi:hypothetical protein
MSAAPMSLQAEQTVLMDIVARSIPVTVVQKSGRILSIAVPSDTDPVRSAAARIVNKWIMQGAELEAMALRILAMSELVAGLIRWRRGEL